MTRLTTVLSLHIVFLLAWSATLVYMPQLLLRQATVTDEEARTRIMVMQRWLYARLMTPSAVLAIVFGTWLIFERGFAGGWMHVKLTLVLLMALFHVYLGQLMVKLRREEGLHGAYFYRVLPVVPAVLILAVIWLVTGKPF